MRLLENENLITTPFIFNLCIYHYCILIPVDKCISNLTVEPIDDIKVTRASLFVKSGFNYFDEKKV